MPRDTHTKRIADELRRMIRSGELSAGMRLRQDHLAAQFGVSSTPIREALGQLAKERLIKHDTHRGAVVFPPTDADVRENFEIRLALEPLATELAAGQLDSAQLDNLERILTQLDDAVNEARRSGSTAQYEQVDRAFHSAIFAGSGRPLLCEMVETLRDAAAAYAHLHMPEGINQKILRRLHEQHRQLLDAVGAGDADRAQAVATQHVLLTAEGSGALQPRPATPPVGLR
jgi:DNA-binding GntR family transcriptional regulator